MNSDEDCGKSDGDSNRIARDYAMMRLECYEASDLKGYCDEDLKDLARDFHDAQCKLLTSVRSSLRQGELQATMVFEKKLKGIKVRLNQLKEVENMSDIPVGSNSGSFLAKLPKITIKIFDGKVDNWVSFKELFDSLIHKRSLPDVEKLHYLLSSVQGIAYDLIKSFPLSDESYTIAYQTLCKYYDRKKQIAFVYYEKILNCEIVKTKNSVELERVHRTFTENLNILLKYNLPDKNFMLYYLLWSKLDSATREAFELQLTSDIDIPNYEDLANFIEKRSRALENSNIKVNIGGHFKPQSVTKNKSSLVVPHVTSCAMCSVAGHNVEKCPNFIKLTPFERFNKIKEKRLCILCLRPSHSVRHCKSSVPCDKCQNRHNSLLHFDNPKEVSDSTVAPKTPPMVTTLTVPGSGSQVLFSTASIFVKNKFNKLTRVRILIDSASACNFITSKCAQRLGLTINNNSQSINGIGQVSTDTLGSVVCEIVPTNGDCSKTFSLEAFVLPQICPDMPSGQIDASFWQHIKDLDLADPYFYKPGPVDMLVNVNFFASILQPGLVKGEPGQPIAVPTVFGWIVMGECSNDVDFATSRSCNSSCVSTKNCLLVSGLSLDNNIKRFWELENVELPKPVVLSNSELSCENHMEANYCRSPEGRMVVPLTFVDPQDKPRFSNSREIALQRLYNLERKFKLNPQFRTAYVNFMDDYLMNGHMEVVKPPSLNDSNNCYYIPHHGVLRPDSVTTPLRTVFDASAKDAQGKSLNETLLPGPKLQKNIFDLLIRFRWHAVVFTGDIKQMYRQFLVDLQDCDYQRILWRPSPDDPVRDFRLLTVTYGVTCAPYQALWCISQLAKEFSSRAPLGAAVLERDTYVDDIVSGSDSVESALQLRKQLLEILSSACLHLRKWTSNNPIFLGSVSAADLYSEQFHHFEDIYDVSLKILGLLWLPKSDEFSFKTTTTVGRCTKRTILSDIARIFDPLGLLSPVVFFAKYLMQLLWLSGVDWDDDAPTTITQEWLKFKAQLSSLSSLAIPRRMIESYVEIQFHGYCDASERGFCAVIFCRVVLDNQQIVVRLCCAKSKVAPLRKLSIPRLELLAAVLLADLKCSVSFALKDLYQIDKMIAWSDSTVALTWIKSCPSRWKTFVANRTSSIQEKIPPDCWRHVPTGDNPADHGSRGMLPADLTRCESWWAGPSWLSRPESEWPKSIPEFDGSAVDEQKILTLFTAINADFVDNILSRFSSFRRLVNVLAYCFRYLHNLKNPNSKLTGEALSSSETKFVIRFLVSHVQERVFATEIRNVLKNSINSLPKAIRKLCPFLDHDGLLRVGGRLSQSQNMDYEKKHPLLLPRDHRLTSLIIEEYHRRFLHPGLQTLQNLLAQEFWILSSKRAIRSVISSCIRCFRACPRVAPPPLMGDLPSFRINQLKPFSSSSVDNAGPFSISLGSLVLIVNELCSPLKWSLGRVVQLHPGTDGICRVVTVRTSTGEYKRPVVKLCPLPMVN